MLVRWVVGAVALFLTVKISEAFHLGLHLSTGTEAPLSALLVIGVLTLVNAFIRPVVAFFFSGLNCLTFGLFTLVINALMFLLTGYIAHELKLGFRVDGFVPALFGSVVLSVISGILFNLIPENSGQRRRR